ncbi:MAG: alpha/beta hydrolase, partial [Deltaproteobacteria bacterium]|nr:alpha/beta hydrolase [Deltaproteobacteria bacterium]
MAELFSSSAKLSEVSPAPIRDPAKAGRPALSGRAAPLLLLSLILALLCSCAQGSGALWNREVGRGLAMGFRPCDLPAPPFRLAGLIKGDKGEDLVVYIEGDGRAVIRGKPSADPTPRLAQSWELARLDPSPLVLYLARIGQFMPAFSGARFQYYWTTGRLAPEVVAGASAAIDEIKRRVGAKRLHLVGFSGGGGLAVLLAGARTDVASLVTVAGLLDTDWWVKDNGWLPLTGSLNPAGAAGLLASIPQIHYYGLSDKVIVPAMSARFAAMAPFASLKRVGLELDHYSGWTDNWP